MIISTMLHWPLADTEYNYGLVHVVFDGLIILFRIECIANIIIIVYGCQLKIIYYRWLACFGSQTAEAIT